MNGCCRAFQFSQMRKNDYSHANDGQRGRTIGLPYLNVGLLTVLIRLKQLVRFNASSSKPCFHTLFATLWKKPNGLLFEPTDFIPRNHIKFAPLACHSTVTNFARFRGLCGRITSCCEVSVHQTTQRATRAMPVIYSEQM